MTRIFDHEKLIVYHKALAFAACSETLVREWGPGHAVTDQLARASESILLNLSDGTTARSVRSRTLAVDYALGSTLECAACLDVSVGRALMRAGAALERKQELAEIARMIVGLRKSWSHAVREEASQYLAETDGGSGEPLFSHERLEVYQVALDFVRWVHDLCSFHGQRSALCQHIDKAATSIVLNIAEGNGRFSELDHRRFLVTAQTAAARAAVRLDIGAQSGHLHDDKVEAGKALLRRIAAMLVPLCQYWDGEYARRGQTGRGRSRR